MEHKSRPLLAKRAYAFRLLKHFLVSSLLIIFSLSIGMAGYHFLANLGWVDSFLNASMILGGMGPVDVLPNDGSKIFAGMYALFSGVVFIVLGGILISPVLHRILHIIHVEGSKK